MDTQRPSTVPHMPGPGSAAAGVAAQGAQQGLTEARERAIRLLTDRYADDTLSELEFESLLDRIHSTFDPAEVDAVVHDLLTSATRVAAPATVPEERRILAVMSQTRHTGRWTVPRLLRVRAVMSEVKLDIRDVPIPDGFTLDVGAYAGNVTLIVPPGVLVAFDVFTVMAKAVNQAHELGAATAAGTPRIHVHGTAFMSEVRVLVRERRA